MKKAVYAGFVQNPPAAHAGQEYTTMEVSSRVVYRGWSGGDFGLLDSVGEADAGDHVFQER